MARELTRGDILRLLRVAVTGKEKSPPFWEVAALLGKEETLSRISKAHYALFKHSLNGN